MTLDSHANIYLAGQDNTGAIPVTIGKFHQDLCSGPSLTGEHPHPCSDGYVMKLDPTGARILYATYLGGSLDDGAFQIAVDTAGNAYVLGATDSTDFPVTAGALQTKPSSAFLVKLNPDGSVHYSTFLPGATDASHPSLLQIDSAGNAYISGSTAAADFPTTPGAFRTAPGPGFAEQGFVMKIDSAGARLVYSTYFDAAPTAMAVNSAGSVYLTGHTQNALTTTPGALQTKLCSNDCGFVSELNPAGSDLIFSTFLGGNGRTIPTAMAVDLAGNVWVTGVTTSTDFPKPSAQGGAFVVKLNSSATAVTNALLFGSGLSSWGPFLALDSTGSVYVAGSITGNFPVTGNALLSAPCVGANTNSGADVLLKLDPSSQVVFASYARQPVRAMAVLPYGQFFSPSGSFEILTGDTVGNGFAQINPATPPPLNFACPVNSASWAQPEFGIAPGEIVSIFGSHLGPDVGVGAELGPDGRINTTLSGTQVLFDGIPAPLLYVQSEQINAIVPFEIGAIKTGEVTIQVQRNGQSAPPLDLVPGLSDTALFTVSGQPGTQGAILNQDGTINSPKNPAKPGTVISVFANGAGLLSPALGDGELAPIPPPWITLANPVTATVMDLPAKVLYAGVAPGLVAGPTQINIQLPASLTSAGTLPISIVTGSNSGAGYSTTASPVLMSVAH